ncbi:MAG: LETM1 domain-containing protein [Altibacter sp.]|uniref:LETM1-related biofilm-associated protein n=1 Tax=Altibacter sp. TaxID=2024823 RepID=UPI001DBE57DA|nr:LETM1-related biofilm-associated protein [Altibacter sp.]MBZ0327281.1 LETM1 domain-containing protein [Altibacter sp.]
MNPSATDWIPKFLSGLERVDLTTKFKNRTNFYTYLKETGFIYGVSVKAILDETVSNLDLTKEEYTKINLFHALLYFYFQSNPKGSFDDAIGSINEFYNKIDKGKTGFLRKLTLSQSNSQHLESVLSSRLQETNTALKKNNTSILTYALLFVDVLAYIKWLSKPRAIKSYAKQLENSVITCCFFALKAKQNKNKYDRLLIDLFESSTEYLIADTSAQDITSLQQLKRISNRSDLEKKYILDICIIAVWDDHEMDASEFNFLQNLTTKLKLPEKELTTSLQDLTSFSDKYTETIQLFEYSNPVKLFYKQSAATVKLLILRNKKRLIRELEESGELLVLLSQSTLRDLNPEEKHKVKEQLLDVCKTIPSLTIFLLPGGTVLLPLLVKFIPKLLPSAFNENRIQDKKN